MCAAGFGGSAECQLFWNRVWSWFGWATCGDFECSKLRNLGELASVAANKRRAGYYCELAFVIAYVQSSVCIA
eukprot:1334242-Pleurochrysis_carterae.AAC.7